MMLEGGIMQLTLGRVKDLVLSLESKVDSWPKLAHPEW